MKLGWMEKDRITIILSVPWITRGPCGIMMENDRICRIYFIPRITKGPHEI